MTTPELTVGYWGIRGLAAPLRMMLMYKNVPFQAENYDAWEDSNGINREQWLSIKPQLKEKNPLINLPYIIDKSTDLVVTQSNACLLYLGKRLNMRGLNLVEETQCEELLFECTDLRNEIVKFVYPPNENPQKWIQGMVKPGHSLDKLNLWLERKYEAGVSGAIFFVGDNATAPDFHIWEMLDQFKGICDFYGVEDPYASLPKLALFHESFKNLPDNQRYFASKLASLPANFFLAQSFGATPDGKKYVAGQPMSWHKSSGVY